MRAFISGTCSREFPPELLNDASIEKTVNEKNGKDNRAIIVYGRTVGFIKADKGYVAEKYRSLGEVKSIIKREREEKNEAER